MKYEWYPFNPSRYRADTMHLTAEQDGIYRRLIDHYMETELPLPDNDLALARIAGVSAECFKSSSTILRAFFVLKNGKLYSKKCDETLSDMNERYEKNQKRGASGGKKRAENLKQKQKPASQAQVEVESDLSATQPPYLTLPYLTSKDLKKIRKENFEKFYNAYPLKQGRAKAEKAFEKVEADIAQIMKAIEKYKREKPEWQEYAHPATWINQRRWEDQYGAEPLKLEWPEWKHTLAKQIGEANVLSWFGDAEMNGRAIYLGKQFQVERVKSSFTEDISKAFGRPYEIKLKEIPQQERE